MVWGPKIFVRVRCGGRGCPGVRCGVGSARGTAPSPVGGVVWVGDVVLSLSSFFVVCSLSLGGASVPARAGPTTRPLSSCVFGYLGEGGGGGGSGGGGYGAARGTSAGIKRGGRAVWLIVRLGGLALGGVLATVFVSWSLAHFSFSWGFLSRRRARVLQGCAAGECSLSYSSAWP